MRAFEWDEEPELNITPLVDVMLVLLAILMLSSHAVTYEEQLQLPKGSRQMEAKNEEALTVRLDAKRIVHIESKTWPLESFPDAFVQMSSGISKERPLFLRAEKSLPYEDVMRVISTVKAAGFTKISLLTDG